MPVTSQLILAVGSGLEVIWDGVSPVLLREALLRLRLAVEASPEGSFSTLEAARYGPRRRPVVRCCDPAPGFGALGSALWQDSRSR